LLSKFDDFFTGWRPICVARIAVEHQRTRLQRFFEFFLTESNCLVVIVRTFDTKLQAVAHEPSYYLRFSAICHFALPTLPRSELTFSCSVNAPLRLLEAV
jgi:hypothetical protein